MSTHDTTTHDTGGLTPADQPATNDAQALDDSVVEQWRQIDDPGAGQRWSTFAGLERLCRGPQPWPDWVVTDASAIDTDLGVLKTGKEADVVLIERASTTDPDRRVVMAAKRYREASHRDFHRSASYTDGRRQRRSRDTRALANKSAYGRSVAAGQWAGAEWSALTTLYAAGLPVPYPVQIDGTEIVMELARDRAGDPAPRLAHTRPSPVELSGWWEQLRGVVVDLAGLGLAHGDLSAYNVLAGRDGLVVIDLPQAVDIVGNPAGLDFLHRDCVNVATWFTSKGHAVDGEVLFGEAVAQAW